MKIAYLINTYPRPSHSFIRREIWALERRGFEVHRFAMRGDREALVDPADIAEHDRTEHVLRSGKRRLSLATLGQFARAPGAAFAALRMAVAVGWHSEAGLWRHLVYLVEACHIAGRARALGIEHLHAHFGTNATTVAMLVQILGGPPYSFTVHGPEEFDTPVTLGLGDKMRRASFTVAVSSFGRSQLCRWAAAEHWTRIHVVHCGIEPARFPEPAPLPATGVRLVSVGRFVEQKGQLLLIEALAQAVAKHPGLHLTLVGDGEMRGEVEAAVERHGLGRHVTITGWVDERRVRAELAAAHALVLPSLAEGLPMVVMEAMAAGRPVIATYIAGMPELVQSGRTGWLVPAGDVEAFAEAMCTLAGTPRERLEAMGRAGRARVLQRHDVDQEAGRLAALFTAAPVPAELAVRAAPLVRQPVLQIRP